MWGFSFLKVAEMRNVQYAWNFFKDTKVCNLQIRNWQRTKSFARYVYKFFYVKDHNNQKKVPLPHT